MITLMVIGVSAIRVSEQADEADDEGSQVRMERQIVYCGLGLGAFVLVTFVPYHRIGQIAYPLFAVTLCLLVLVFFLPRIRNSHRWIDLKIMLVQPSEIAKLSYVVLLAWYLRYRDNYRRLLGLLVPLLLTLVPMALILKEPDLGTSLLFLPTLFFVMFMAGAKWQHMLGTLGIAIVLLFLPVPQATSGRMSPAEITDRRALAYFSVQYRGREYLFSAAPLAAMEYHQIKRIDGWLRQGDAEVAANKGYQLRQSKMILGSGRFTGRGGWSDAETAFRMLPDDHTDFIFSIVGGQWGFAGCAAVLMLYGVIFLFGVEIAVVTYDPFGRLLAIGVLAILFSQIIINVGMTMGLMPITGMTLPLISYGGSSLVVNCAALGLLVNIGQRRPILLGKRPFEYDEKEPKPPAPYGPLAEGANWSRWRKEMPSSHRDRQ